MLEAMRACLVSGRLKPDDTLPTVRDLATDLSVHFNTVAEAYRILTDERWLELKRRRGARVLPCQTPVTDAGRRASLPQRLRELVSAMRAEGVTENRIRQQFEIAVEGLKLAP